MSVAPEDRREILLPSLALLPEARNVNPEAECKGIYVLPHTRVVWEA